MKHNAISSILIMFMVTGLLVLTGPGCQQAQDQKKSAEAVSKTTAESDSDQACLKSFFTKSLHFTGN